ncbi:MAG: hypothetical protein ABI758_04615 [Candidatus Woesebacteria bacterium]
MPDNARILLPTAMMATARDEQAQSTKAQSSAKKLDDLAYLDDKALFVSTTVFPLDLFPDVLTVDRNKITISKRYFLSTRTTQSIMIKDIMTIVVQEAFLFATLVVVDRLLPHQAIKIGPLPKGDARKARWILEGLLISDKEKIDCSKIPTDELVPRLEQIGKTKTT